MKKFLLKILLFLSPFLVALGLELFVLPIDFFTFRSHEALLIRKFHNLLPGKFYPNMTLVKEEEGDLGHHTKYSLRRTVKWITDSYGYRKKGSDRLEYEVVIIGQSETVGVCLSQDEMLSEVLQEQLNMGVYPFAPAGVNAFLRDKRFNLRPPKIVIFSCVDKRALFLAEPIKIRSRGKWVLYETFQNKFRGLKDHRWVQSAGVILDRLYKLNMIRYLRASLERKFSNKDISPSKRVDSKFGTILFLQGAKANQEVPEENLNQAVQKVKSYHDQFKSRGIRFIFLPIPDKETIYYEFLRTPRPIFLRQLVDRLEQLGVETVDTQPAFEKALQGGVIPYRNDDTHWNADGVKIAAGLVKILIEERMPKVIASRGENQGFFADGR